METFEHYQKQFKRASEDALMMDEHKKRGVADHLVTLLRGRSNKYKRAIALVSIIRSIVPFEMKYEYDTESMPFDGEKYKFADGKIGSGGENDVYILESTDAAVHSWALKINHADGGSTEKLISRAKEIKSEYEEVASWYDKDMPGFVPKEYSLIMEDPRFGKPAIVTLQQFYGSGIKDIFEMINWDNFDDILDENPNLRQDIFEFIDITESKERETGLMVDLLGPKNIAVVKSGGKERLLLLDPHLVSMSQRSEEKRKLRQRWYLDNLRKAVGYEEEMEVREVA